MTKEKLKDISQSIKNIEERIVELEKELRSDSTTRHKLNMQHTLKTNKDMLAKMKEYFWKES